MVFFIYFRFVIANSFLSPQSVRRWYHETFFIKKKFVLFSTTAKYCYEMYGSSWCPTFDLPLCCSIKFALQTLIFFIDAAGRCVFALVYSSFTVYIKEICCTCIGHPELFFVSTASRSSSQVLTINHWLQQKRTLRARQYLH